jgi:hypothetical protein
MANEVQTHTGSCTTHGTVEASREIPKMGFPPGWFAIARALAKRRPYLCPECHQPVSL